MVKPGMDPPPGKVSNFDDPEREMYYICIVSNAIAISICSIFMFLRLWARYRLSMRLRIDDSMIRPILSHFLLLISATVACIIGYVGDRFSVTSILIH